jgi:hypothetical protein
MRWDLGNDAHNGGVGFFVGHSGKAFTTHVKIKIIRKINI